MPSIGKFYCLGRVDIPEGELPFTEESMDIFINSFQGRTIGPADPPSPFNSLHFLDTLKSYINESRTLGWITSQPVAEKYLALVDSARAQIARNVSKVARTTLNTILQEVETDSGASLTSEAYALLRFNTEYLLPRLPTLTVSFSVDEEWNITSVPVEVGNFAKSVLRPTAISNAFTYQEGTGYVQRDTLANGPGYWLEYGGSESLADTGLGFDTLSVPVQAGWNLIGSLSFPLDKSVVYPYPPGVTILSPYYRYSTDAGYEDSDLLKPGEGYWVNVSDSGKLILGLPPPWYPELPPPDDPPAPPGAPSAPVLASPQDEAGDQPLTLPLSWNAASGAASYRLQVSSDENFIYLVVDEQGITATSRIVGALEYMSLYYWRVNASSAVGTSDWSAVWKFKTRKPDGTPDPPVLADPENGSTNVSTWPTLKWNASDGAVEYRAQISLTDDFSNLVYDEEKIYEEGVEAGPLAQDTEHFWRVKAGNQNGWGDWSAAWRFVTEGGQALSPCAPYTSRQTMDEIKITEGSGRGRAMYLHNGGRGVHLGHPRLLMPPEPRSGVFDARFQTGRYIERVRPGRGKTHFPIRVRDARSPLTLSWKIQEENKIQYWLIIPGDPARRIPLTGTGSRTVEPVAAVILIEAEAEQPCRLN